MTMLDDLGDYLDGLGIGALPDGNGLNGTLFLGMRPPSPDDLLSLMQYPGGPPEYVQESFAPIAEHLRLQVVARAIRYEDAEAMINEAWAALAPITNADIGGSHYRSVRPNASPALMGRDANDRVLLFFNAEVHKEVNLVVVS